MSKFAFQLQDNIANNCSSLIQIFISRKLFIIIDKAHHFFPFFPSGALAGAVLAAALAGSGAFAGAFAGPFAEAAEAFGAGAEVGLAGAAVLAGAAADFAGAAVLDGAAGLDGVAVLDGVAALAGAAGATGASTNNPFLAFFSFKYLERSFS